MNKILALGLLFGAALTAQPAMARNTVTNYPIEAIRAQPEYAEKSAISVSSSAMRPRARSSVIPFR